MNHVSCRGGRSGEREEKARGVTADEAQEHEVCNASIDSNNNYNNNYNERMQSTLHYERQHLRPPDNV